jgi:hypothetical protein
MRGGRGPYEATNQHAAAGRQDEPAELSYQCDHGSAGRAEERTDPVQRGRFVVESMPCRTVPELPIGQVPDLRDLGPNATVRDRLKMHAADPACAAFHKLMDPIGLALEGYDHLGRFPTTEAGKPVDASAPLCPSPLMVRLHELTPAAAARLLARARTFERRY